MPKEKIKYRVYPPKENVRCVKTNDRDWYITWKDNSGKRHRKRFGLNKCKFFGERLQLSWNLVSQIKGRLYDQKMRAQERAEQREFEKKKAEFKGLKAVK